MDFEIITSHPYQIHLQHLNLPKIFHLISSYANVNDLEKATFSFGYRNAVKK